MRVDQSAAGVGPQLDATPNGSQANATPIPVTSSAQGSYGGSAAGALPAGDNGDYYALGTLNAGNAIGLTVTAPSISSLYTGSSSPPAVQLSLELAGNNTPVATSTTGSLNYTIPSGADGAYYVVVQALSGYQSIRAQYLLSASVVDGVAPTATLASPTSPTNTLVENLTLTFSKDLAAATVNNASNYVLQDSHGNSYHARPQAATRRFVRAETITIVNAPLQPGTYTLTLSGLTDRAQNLLAAPTSFTFVVQGVPPYVIQNYPSTTLAAATPLVTPTRSQPDGGSFTVGNS